MKTTFRKMKKLTWVLIGVLLLSACGSAEPDYYFEQEFTLSAGDTVNLEEGIRFTVETLDYLTETENYRVDYVMSKDGENYPGRYFMDKEGEPFQYVEVYNIHPITLVEVNGSQATFVVSAAPEIPAPLEVSGSVKGMFI